MDKLIDILKEVGKIKYSDDYILRIAKQYKHVRDFAKAHRSLYQAASDRGLMKDIWKFMEPLGNKFNRLVYVYTFPEEKDENGVPVKYAYVGLTGDENERDYQHNKETAKQLSPVLKHKQKSNNKPNKEVVSNGYIPYKEAQDLEREYMEKYRNEGWILLNTRQGGGLGGGKLKYTDTDLMNIAKQYSSVSEFVEKNKPAYNAASDRGILKNIIPHMSRKRVDYTEDNIRTIAKKYNNRTEFADNNPNAYAAARRRGILDDVCKHMTDIKYKKRTDQEILDIATKYKDVGEFRRSEPAIYQTAQRKGLLSTINQQIKDKVSPPVGNVK
jgi:hypothetical protein